MNFYLKLLMGSSFFFLLGSDVQAGVRQQEISVNIEGMQFNPKIITISNGQRIKWVNQDLVPHTVTSEGNFNSKIIQPGKSWMYKLKKKGNFEYKCQLHPNMFGTVEVK